MDLEEWWGEDGPMPVINEIPLEDLVRQHRVRYIVHTAQGDIVGWTASVAAILEAIN